MGCCQMAIISTEELTAGHHGKDSSDKFGFVPHSEFLPVKNIVVASNFNDFSNLAESGLNVLEKQTTQNLALIKDNLEVEKMSQFVDQNIKDPVLLLEGQMEGYVREGIQATLDAIQDLRLKQRVSDIIYPIFRKFFVHSCQGRLEDTYDVQEIIGQGSVSTVRRAIHFETSIERAVKIITKNSLTETQTLLVSSETEVLKTLDHPNIVKIIEVVEDTTKMNIVTELCRGGELFDRIVKSKTFSENLAAKYMSQIFSALIHIHEQRIVHRDLKPENIVFESEDDDVLKIIDFGIAQKEQENKSSRRFNGTPFYVSPETLSGEYCCKSDIWSAGVILYIMLCGHPPFAGKTETDTLSKISRGVFNFSGKEWSGVSKEAKNFIQRLLSKDLSKRLTAQEAWADPWVQSRVKKEWEDQIIERTTLESLANFHTSSKFQQSTLSFIASHLTKSDEVKELENAFMILDSNGDGRLSISELRNGFSNISLSIVVDINEIIKKCDLDVNGMINYSEFITATMDWGKVLTQERLDIVFKVVDSDMSGTIGLEDIKRFLGSNDKEEVYEKILKDADDNGDGVIDYEEFKKIMMEIVKLS